jgi:acyl-CoA thioester hydrolase
MDLQLDLKKFKHKYQLRTRNYEVDSIGIVHNAIYLEYCENGRVEYVRNLGFKLLPGGVFDNGVKVMVRKNEINYYNPIRIDQLIDIYTRISYLKNSSFCFEHLVLNAESGLIHCDLKSININLNPYTEKPERLPDKYRDMIIKFEGNEVELIS